MQSNKIHNVVLMSKFIQHFLLARHVSDLTGPSSGAFCTSCIRRLWYVVIRVLLDTSSRYKLYSQIWYVVIRVLLDTSSRYEVVVHYWGNKKWSKNINME